MLDLLLFRLTMLPQQHGIPDGQDQPSLRHPEKAGQPAARVVAVSARMVAA
jgi:hypothetical protein